MNDFRIQVFLSVIKHLSFTKASKELLISQPAISKHITELENKYGVQLFERSNNRVVPTKEALLFRKYAQEIDAKYRNLEYEMNALSHTDNGKLVLGASTTIAQYVLPYIISAYKKQHPNIELSLITGNTEQIETLIAEKNIDLGIVEGASHKREFNYSLFSHDELVLVASPKWMKEEEIKSTELLSLPLILREEGSGTLEVIKNMLNSHSIKISNLNIVMRLGNSEAIKRYVATGDACAFMSIAAITDELKRNQLKVVEIEDVEMKREFSFITNSGDHNRLVDKFINFAIHYNKKL